MSIFKAKTFIKTNKPYTSRFGAEARYDFCYMNNYMHSHDFYEIAYVCKNTGMHITSDGTERINTGDFIFLSPSIKHCPMSYTDKSLPLIHIQNSIFCKDFFEKKIDKYLSDYSYKNTALHELLKNKEFFCILLHDDEGESIKNCIMSIKAECMRGELANDDIIKNLIHNFLMIFSRIYDENLGRVVPHKSMDTRISDILDYMKMHLSLPLTLDLLAEQVHISPEYLSRYFKKHTEKSIWEMLIQMRMEKATVLLLRKEYTVAQTAYMCGYPSLSNFRRAFYKSYACTPTEYKKQHTLVNN